VRATAEAVEEQELKASLTEAVMRLFSSNSDADAFSWAPPIEYLKLDPEVPLNLFFIIANFYFIFLKKRAFATNLPKTSTKCSGGCELCARRDPCLQSSSIPSCLRERRFCDIFCSPFFTW